MQPDEHSVESPQELRAQGEANAEFLQARLAEMEQKRPRRQKRDR
jgi:hypothetical protein